MKDELARIVGSAPAHASMRVGTESWNLYIYGVTRVGHDLFLQLALLGPRVCTLTVRAPAPIGNVVTARRVLAVVHDWIQSDDSSEHGYLEISRLTELAS